MFDKIKNLFFNKQYLVVGQLYSPKQNVTFNNVTLSGVHEYGNTLFPTPKGTILLLLARETTTKNVIKYTFFCDNKKFYHFNSAENEKFLAKLFDHVI